MDAWKAFIAQKLNAPPPPPAAELSPEQRAELEEKFGPLLRAAAQQQLAALAATNPACALEAGEAGAPR